ncbi:MAG: DM13 domain-containing protein [Pseudomonadota bacterium]
MRRIATAALGAAAFFAASLAQAGETGSFKGLSNHVTKGSVEVVKADGGWEIHLKDDFWFDGAPDPRVGFGNDGSFVDPTDFEPLRENAGAQVYKVPANIDPTQFNEVYIWCRKFSVPLGVAALN